MDNKGSLSDLIVNTFGVLYKTALNLYHSLKAFNQVSPTISKNRAYHKTLACSLYYLKCILVREINELPITFKEGEKKKRVRNRERMRH